MYEDMLRFESFLTYLLLCFALETHARTSSSSTLYMCGESLHSPKLKDITFTLVQNREKDLKS